MKRLIAERSVLYLGRMYAPGDALPASDGIMVAAWLRAKSAKWTGEAAEPQQSAQEDAAKTDGSQDSQGQNEGQEGKENGQEAKMVEGHLDPDQLSTMKKSDLVPASAAAISIRELIFPAPRTTRSGRS